MDAASTTMVIDVKHDDNTWIYQLDKSLEDNDAWLNRLRKRVTETEEQDPKCTIFEFPRQLRLIDPSVYEPQILSLGPYHHGKPDLIAMEELKWRYLKKFLNRNQERGLEDYVKLVVAMEIQTREAYSKVSHMDSKQWVEMMLLDSCFVVEFIQNEGNPTISESVYLESDMLLLENQLPFFLLEKLAELNSLPNLAEKTFDRFKGMMPGNIQRSSLESISDIYHILHLLYSCMLPNDRTTPSTCGLGRRLLRFCKFTRRKLLKIQRMPSAKNLKDAGVAFRKKTKNQTSFMDITFRKGTLEIPPLKIFDHCNLLFRNLMAFEQCRIAYESATPLAAYAFIMDCIIDTPADVDLLQQQGIIVSLLGNADDIAQLFNQLGKNILLGPNYYLYGVHRDVLRHCDKSVNKWKASLNHNYFSNPWAFVSSIAAIFLILLTLTQTVFTVLSFFSPRSP